MEDKYDKHSDSSLLDWLTLKLEDGYDLQTYLTLPSAKRVWRIYDGQVAAYASETIGKGSTLREAIINAIDQPYA
jgi:hypothetical protein